VNVEATGQWNSRGHFFGAAAEAMRRILVENARRKAGPQAGGGMKRLDISHVHPEFQESGLDLIALHEAIERLAVKDARKAELVKLRFFAGLTNEQAAHALGITARTAYADWAYAKAWLRVEISTGPNEER
jgi:RNA polymerase sigma factor (TIGR02999 family)